MKAMQLHETMVILLCLLSFSHMKEMFMLQSSGSVPVTMITVFVLADTKGEGLLCPLLW